MPGFNNFNNYQKLTIIGFIISFNQNHILKEKGY